MFVDSSSRDKGTAGIYPLPVGDLDIGIKKEAAKRAGQLWLCIWIKAASVSWWGFRGPSGRLDKWEPEKKTKLLLSEYPTLSS
jgi:hypothetical protein